jgi:hypothetical protein
MKTFFNALIIVSCWFLVLLANTIRVPQDQPSIQDGINAAVNGDTVLVEDSTYYENINFMGKAITVASYFLVDGDSVHIDSTIINGSQPVIPDLGSVVSFVSGEDTTSVLYGFTITRGSGTWYIGYSARVGGGINCYNSSCRIIANKIINNSVTGPFALGGGLAALPPGSNANVVLKDNQITYNTVTANSAQAIGGGVWLFCNAKITSNSISHNTCIGNPNSDAPWAGGIGCYADPPSSLEIMMEKNTITHNSVESHGSLSAGASGAYFKGANGRVINNEISFNEYWDYSSMGSWGIGVQVVNSPDSFLVEGNIIRENAEKQGTGISEGGGLRVWGTGNISVINNLIVGNSATHGGGLVITSNTTVEIVNNTIINNYATYGGGISVHGASTGYVMNTIVWGNQAGGIHIESGSIHVAYSDVQGGWPGTGNRDEDPLLEVDSLTNASPCIGAGTSVYDFGGGMMCYSPPEDMNGRARPYPAGSNPDMGAWESKRERSDGIGPQAIVGIPKSYELSQNYPNPFNPITNIEFQIANFRFVSLKVYDITGREVATLVSEKLPAGKYKYDWDASNLASGVYFYELKAGQFTRVRKMALVR